MKLVLGSTSAIKKTATELALNRLGLKIPLIYIAAESGVNEQPEGLLETRRGAYGRALTALLKCPDAHIGVGIENGLFAHEGGMADRAICLLLVRGYDGPEHWRYLATLSAPVMMPAAAVKEARRRGLASTTVGHVLQEYNPQISATDPHMFLTGRPRADFLADALQDVMVTLQLQGVLPPSPPLRASAYGLG